MARQADSPAGAVVARAGGVLRGWRNAGRVPRACKAIHRRVLQARASRLALVLAVLSLAWIPLDFAWLGAGRALPALPLRVAIALVLFAFARIAPRLPTHAVVPALACLQAVAFTALQLLVDPSRQGALQIGYGLFAFLVAAQLALFPQAWWRTLLAALAPAAQFVVVRWLAPPPLAEALSNAWLFILIVAMAAWTSQAQLRLLVDLVGARHDAFHDPLTGLANRRSADERLEAARAQALRNGQPMSVLMLDLDRFKRVNDRWGHANGDRVLVMLADVLRAELRAGDLAARHGGEEFLALLPGSDVAQALEAAERIRRSVAARRITFDGSDEAIGITVSIGIATLEGDETVEQLIARADAAMYHAKGEGRDRCVAASAADAAAARA
jgi:diguanylate cyclase (GGDEF)-like protein